MGMITPEEQWRNETAKALGRIEGTVQLTHEQVTALNATVASQGERISALEGGRRAIKWVVASSLAFIGILASAAIAYIKDGD